MNEGWLDAEVFGPVAQLAWEAVSSKINSNGEVEGVCVGTGMAFDHGYGPVIWAGSEIIKMLRNSSSYMNDSAIHYYSVDPEAPEDMPIFSLDSNGKAVKILH